MKKARWLFPSVLLCAVLWIHPAFACRYNVRETGFVDLGIDPYILCGYVDGNTPPGVAADFKKITDEIFLETNVIFRLVDMDRRKDHSAIKHFDPNVQSAPAAVLVSPDGQTLPIPVRERGELFEKSFRAALDRVLFSPQRSEILKQVSKAYGVIMLIEGPDAEENALAKKEASSAVEAVASQMEFMPKEIVNPPKLVVMDANTLGEEEVLLWSLGLEAKDVNEPMAIVLYGRARWIGPLFRGEQINEDDLASVLFIIGADCECGLDFRWLQGTMLPTRWDRKTHERAVASLGFDPESPMIKMEIG